MAPLGAVLPDGTECLVPKWVNPVKVGDDWALKGPDGSTDIAIQKKGMVYFDQTYFPYAEDPEEKIDRMEELRDYNMWTGVAASPGPIPWDEDGWTIDRLSSTVHGLLMKFSIVLSTQPAQFQAATFKGDLETNLAEIASLRAVIIIGLIRGIVKPGVNHTQAMDWLVEALRECSSAARAHGIRLALEPINRYETTLINNAAEGLDLIEHVGADNFGLLLDTFHMNIEEADIQTSIRACGKHTFHFHVADSNRWYPGAGHLDFSSILKALSTVDYKGWVSGEFLPIPSAEIAAKEIILYLKEIRKGYSV